VAVETFVDAMMTWSSNEAQTTADEDNASVLRKKMEAAFQEEDADETGKLDRDQIKAALTSVMGDEVSKEDTKAIVQKMFPDG